MRPPLDYIVGTSSWPPRTSSMQLRACRQRMRDIFRVTARCRFLWLGSVGRSVFGPEVRSVDWSNKIAGKWFTTALACISQSHGASTFGFCLFFSPPVAGRRGFVGPLLALGQQYHCKAKGMKQAICKAATGFGQLRSLIAFFMSFFYFFFWEELHLLNCCPHKEFLRFAKKVTSFRFLNLNVFILIWRVCILLRYIDILYKSALISRLSWLIHYKESNCIQKSTHKRFRGCAKIAAFPTVLIFVWR